MGQALASHTVHHAGKVVPTEGEISVPSVEWNRVVWGSTHEWDKDGDEWSGMARYCGQPYQEWKADLVGTFIEPVPRGARILEIGPGHGRWTEYLLQRAASLDLVDVNQTCLDSCRERFAGHDDIRFHLTDDCSLGFLDDGSVDFAWSFDAFVHMEEPVIQGYVTELGRVLASGGRAVIHHADKPKLAVTLAPVRQRLGRPGVVLERAAVLHRLRDGGHRSDVTAAMVATFATAAGLRVTDQVDAWGDGGRHTVRKYRDKITLLRKP
jgi:SAM-dependent methyltransferase